MKKNRTFGKKRYLRKYIRTQYIKNMKNMKNRTFIKHITTPYKQSYLTRKMKGGTGFRDRLIDGYYDLMENFGYIRAPRGIPFARVSNIRPLTPQENLEHSAWKALVQEIMERHGIEVGSELYDSIMSDLTSQFAELLEIHIDTNNGPRDEVSLAMTQAIHNLDIYLAEPVNRELPVMSNLINVNAVRGIHRPDLVSSAIVATDVAPVTAFPRRRRMRLLSEMWDQ